MSGRGSSTNLNPVYPRLSFGDITPYDHGNVIGTILVMQYSLLFFLYFISCRSLLICGQSHGQAQITPANGKRYVHAFVRPLLRVRQPFLQNVSHSGKQNFSCISVLFGLLHNIRCHKCQYGLQLHDNPSAICMSRS